MQLTFILAALVSLVAANGTIQRCTGNNGAGTCESGTYIPPNNCNGGCVKVTDKSAREVSADSGYCCKLMMTMDRIAVERVLILDPS